MIWRALEVFIQLQHTMTRSKVTLSRIHHEREPKKNRREKGVGKSW